MESWFGVRALLATTPQKNNSFSLLLPLLLVVGMYFFFIRPQRARAKQSQSVRSQLSPGQRIVTIGGIFGTVTDVTDDDFGLLVADGVQLRFVKSAMARVIESPPDIESIPEDPAHEA